MPGSSTASWRSRPTPCAFRRGMPDVASSRAGSGAVSRCASCLSRRPTCCCSMSPPTIWMRNRWRGWKSFCTSIPAPSLLSPTTATSGQCRRLDPRARPRSRYPMEGQLLVVAGAKGAAARGRSTPAGAHRKTIAARDSSGCVPIPKDGAPKARRGSASTRTCARASSRAQRDKGDLHTRQASRLGDLVIEASNVSKSYGERLLIDELSFNCRAAPLWASSGQTAPARHLDER